ncbi:MULTISPECIES: DsbA family protein [Nesterenkonia]|uniref:Protein-disulfide isomerase n=1 Tax=Nesterenkonia aurantiaca TaxID=1436010 RepID=A0A4R7FW54_9MICC|nr:MULTISPECIES: thioredoxin domain-containing protein [Nesterenkonia]TDS82945.1 protein-disulfide isomerase [Nesterenkonia aurantiaca]
MSLSSPATPTIRPRRNTLLPLFVILIAAALIGFVIWQNAADDAPESTQDAVGQDTAEPDAPGPDSQAEGPVAVPEGGAEPEQEDMSDIERRDPDDLLSLGPADAPVAMVMFSDAQCPFCATWHEQTLPTMMEYVDAGELRIEWRDVNVFGEASERAARATYAAAMQDEFMEYQGLLFAGGETRPEAGLTEQGLVDLAEQVGLDTAQFQEDMNSPEVSEQIASNAQEGLDIGAYSTPAFIVAGEPIIGAQPTEVFVSAVDDALAEGN